MLSNIVLFNFRFALSYVFVLLAVLTSNEAINATTNPKRDLEWLPWYNLRSDKVDEIA
jgi:hypothetical protein